MPLPPESADAFKVGRFPGLINALYVYAMGHPGVFPGGDARGFRAVSGAVQELVGVRLDAVVVVNLAGFVQLVDAIGGLWIAVPERLVDLNYPLEDGSGQITLDIRPGCQRLDGRMALAYARSRHQDSDYGRMARQQAVLLALSRQVDPIALLPRVPKLLDIAKQEPVDDHPTGGRARPGRARRRGGHGSRHDRVVRPVALCLVPGLDRNLPDPTRCAISLRRTMDRIVASVRSAGLSVGGALHGPGRFTSSTLAAH